MKPLLPPSPTTTSESARTWGIVSIATGVVSLLVLPILFGPAAVISGVVAVNLRNRLGWWGIVLGGIATFIVVSALWRISNTLNQIG